MNNLFLLLDRGIGRRRKRNGCDEDGHENTDFHASIPVPMPGQHLNGDNTPSSTRNPITYSLNPAEMH